MIREREIDGSIKPAIPYLEFYGASSEPPLVGWQWYPIIWNTWNIITSDFIIKDDGMVTSVVIQTTGLYRIDFQLKMCSGEGDGNYKSHLLLNTVEVQYSVGFSHAPIGNCITLFTTITLYLHKNDIIVCEWATDNATNCTGEDSVFRINYVPMLGWNNNQAGVAVNRGIRR